MEATTDAELVGLARSGNKDAFGVLVERYEPMARRVATGMVHHPDIAQEPAQEAVLQAYLSLDRLRDVSRFESWLYGIVLNVCKSHLRDQKTVFFSLEALTGGLRLEAMPLGAPEPDSQEVVEAQELHRVVLRAVGSLSPKNRAATLMHYYDQLSVREIAATLNITVTAVKGRLHKARGQLRELLLATDPDLGPGEVLTDKEETRMVDVTIADIRSYKITDEQTGEQISERHMVVLLDRQGQRVLPVWIHSAEANAIAIGLEDYEVPRPLTHKFLADVVAATGATLDEVQIAELRGDTFYAVAKLRIGDEVREVDCRPSDAMALAVYLDKPIRVAEDILARAGKALPEDIGEREPSRAGTKKLIEAIGESQHRHASKVGGAELSPEQMAALFGPLDD